MIPQSANPNPLFDYERTPLEISRDNPEPLTRAEQRKAFVDNAEAVQRNLDAALDAHGQDYPPAQVLKLIRNTCYAADIWQRNYKKANRYPPEQPDTVTVESPVGGWVEGR